MKDNNIKMRLNKEIYSINRNALRLNFFLTMAFAILILIMMNYLSFKHFARWDISSKKDNSISEKSKIILGQIKNKIDVKVLLRRNDILFEPVSDILENFAAISPFVKIEYINPDTDPLKSKLISEKYGFNKSNFVIFEYMNSHRYSTRLNMAEFEFFKSGKVTKIRIKKIKAENAFISAINDLINKKRQKIYFTIGHGESVEKKVGIQGMSAFLEELSFENFNMDFIETTNINKIPSDCSVLIIMGPKFPFLENELKLIELYLKNGGNCLFLLDPVLSKKGFDFVDFNLDQLFEIFSVIMNNNVIFDQDKASIFTAEIQTGGLYILNYGTHVIVNNLLNYPTILNATRSITAIKDTNNNNIINPLLITSDKSWGESSLLQLSKTETLKFDKTKDIKGPLFAGVAVINKKFSSKLVLIGNSTFLNNLQIKNGVNSNVGVNSVLWLAQEKTDTLIPVKDIKVDKVNLTSSQLENIVLLFMLGFPSIVIATGTIVFWARRI